MSGKNIQISVIQSELYWENKKANFDLLENQLSQIPVESAIVVLPEMFSTGFTMNAKN